MRLFETANGTLKAVMSCPNISIHEFNDKSSPKMKHYLTSKNFQALVF